MALIDCPACSYEVSSEAASCPSCGHPIDVKGADLVRALQAREARREDLAGQADPRWDWGRIADFRSRTRRVEFWAAWAIGISTILVGGFADMLVWDGPGLFLLISVGVWLWLYVGATVNRFHDMGYSGWMVLLGFLPILSFVVLVWVGTQAGQVGPNDWGPPVA